MEGVFKKAAVQLQGAADFLKKESDYYATEAGREELGEAARQTGRFIGATGRFLWTVGEAIVGGTARKAKTCWQVGGDIYKGEYGQAGKKVFDMEVDRLKALGKTAAAAAGAVVDGAVLLVSKNEEAARTQRLQKRLKQCAIAGGVILAGGELLDGDIDEAEAAGEMTDGLPLMSVADMPGVKEGVLVDASPENLEALAGQGEFAGTIHHSDVIRHPEVRAAFLEAHGFSETPPGWEVHHIVPLSEGGDDSVDNMVLLRSEDHDWITARHRGFYGWPGPEHWGQG